MKYSPGTSFSRTSAAAFRTSDSTSLKTSSERVCGAEPDFASDLSEGDSETAGGGEKVNRRKASKTGIVLMAYLSWRLTWLVKTVIEL